MRHVHGRDNTVADALSRVELGGPPVCMAVGSSDLDLISMAQAQQEDDSIQAYRTAVTPWVLADIPVLVPRPPCYATPRLALHGRLFPPSGDGQSLMQSTAWHTQASGQHGSW